MRLRRVRTAPQRRRRCRRTGRRRRFWWNWRRRNGRTGSCLSIKCAVPACLGGELQPNPSDPCCPVICVPNLCGPIACPMLACVNGYLPSPDPCGCPTCAPNPDAGMLKDAGNRDTRGNPRDAVSPADAGARAPLQHRAAGTTCPAARAPGTNSCNCAGPPGACSPCAGFPGGCGQDSDCTAGINGRCLDLGPLPSMSCSYDGCFSDADCPANTPCDCRDSTLSQTANSCLTGSNCRVDSDCGPGGFCSPSQASWNELTYDCHTANDKCLNNSDCASNENCVFGQLAGYWSCAVIPPSPP